MCSAESRETVLIFHHVRGAERVTLEMALCEECGSNIEKHLKRAVPKRLMNFQVIERLAALYAAQEAEAPTAEARKRPARKRKVAGGRE